MDKRQAAFVKFVPFIKFCGKGYRCDGYKWGQIPLKALYNWGPGNKYPPVGKEKWRCENNAKYKFIALKPRANDWFGETGTSGYYCYCHLQAQVRNEREWQRLLKWSKKFDAYLGEVSVD
jgi:hypothetical protein